MAKKKKKATRKPSKYNKLVGKYRKQGKTFKQAVVLAKRDLRGSKSRRAKRPSKTRKRVRMRSARSNKKASKKVKTMSRMTSTEEQIWRGVGSSLSGTFGGLVKKLIGVDLPQNIASIAGGWLIDKNTSGRVKRIGQGMLIKGVGDVVEENVLPRLGGMVSGNSGTSTTNGASATSGGWE